MHERDLRRLALESGKTMSKKAKAKALSSRSSAMGSPRGSAVNSPAVSPGHSPNGSRIGSRAGSRHGSDEDSDSDSDGLASSVASLDINGYYNEYAEAVPEVWEHQLNECIEQIIERSRNTRNTGEAREEMLAIYANILKAQYAADSITNADELVQALLKSCRSGASEKEAVYALQAIAVTAITTGEVMYHDLESPLKARISDNSSELVQTTAVHTLGLVAFFGGAGYSDCEELLEYFLDIIQSDGESVKAQDSALVVTAALQQWGFIATQVADMDGTSEEPLSAFEDQLDSSNVAVQIAAGDNIGLLFEKSYTPREEDEDSDVNPDDQGDDFEYGKFKRKKWVQRYEINAHDEYNLKSKLAQLSKTSARNVAKDKRKDLHKAFSDILHTVEHPWRGPRFSTALDEDATRYMGHRLVVRAGKDSSYVIDRWWKYARYETIKRVLGGGFQTHFRLNSLVREALPSGLEAPVDD